MVERQMDFGITKENKVKTLKFMTTIDIYPNGKTYVRSFLIEQKLRDMSKGKKKRYKELPVKSVESSEKEII